jgi:hypothetical protein
MKRWRRVHAMLPLSNSSLPLTEMAAYWSREIGCVRPSAEIFDQLLSDFWLDELQATGADGKKEIDRCHILSLVNRCRAHPGFSLIESSEEGRRLFEHLPSGSVLVDVNDYIVLPADHTTWSEAILGSAYEQMSRVLFDDFADVIRPAFLCFHLSRAALRRYCGEKGYQLPRFWFSGGRDRAWNSAVRRKASNWLTQLAKGPKVKPKEAYFVEALRSFPGIPRRAFDKMWHEIVPDGWRRSGPVVRSTRHE